MTNTLPVISSGKKLQSRATRTAAAFQRSQMATIESPNLQSEMSTRQSYAKHERSLMQEKMSENVSRLRSEHLQRRDKLKKEVKHLKEHIKFVKSFQLPQEDVNSFRGTPAQESDDSEEISDEEGSAVKRTQKILVQFQNVEQSTKQGEPKDRNKFFKEIMKNNESIIFPKLPLESWDGLPRFTFLDADFKKQKHEAPIIIRQSTKSKFIGSPMRPKEEGGLLRKEPKPRRVERVEGDKEDPDVVIRPQHVSTTADPSNCKGICDLQIFLNDIGMQKFKDRVPASPSINLSKQERTRLAFQTEKRDNNHLNNLIKLHTMLTEQTEQNSGRLKIKTSRSQSRRKDEQGFLNQKLAAQIEQQRRKLEIEILSENQKNQINQEIIKICEIDLLKPEPTRDDFKFEEFNKRIAEEKEKLVEQEAKKQRIKLIKQFKHHVRHHRPDYIMKELGLKNNSNNRR